MYVLLEVAFSCTDPLLLSHGAAFMGVDDCLIALSVDITGGVITY